MLTNANIFVKQYLTYGAWYTQLVGISFTLKEFHSTKILDNGVATEMLKMAQRVARKEYQLNTLYCNVTTDNIPSIRTAEKLGFNVYHGK